MTKEDKPLAFRSYVLVLVAVLTAATIVALRTDQRIADGLPEFIALTLLLFFAERSDLSFYDGHVRLALSPGEVVLFPMLFALSSGQVLLAAIIAVTAVCAGDLLKEPLKNTFNIAQYGCAAFAAVTLWRFGHEGTNFTLRNVAAGAAAVVLFVIVTHVAIPIGIWLAGQGRLRDVVDDLALPVFLNLGGNVVLGLFLAAAYVATPWMLLLFPVALAGLYFAFRAVVRQGAERHRIEQLHEASRSLAAAAELEKALGGFLLAVADVASALGARAVVRTSRGLFSSSVYAGDEIEILAPVTDSRIEAFLDVAGETRLTLVFGEEGEPVPDSLRIGAASRNLVSVPVREEEQVSGLLIVSDRVGADEFGPGDIRLLEALANELALTLQSYRLFEEVTEEKEKFSLLVDAVTDYAIYLLDPQGHVVSWNGGAERILGYSSTEIVGRHHGCFYPPESNGSWHDELHEAAVSGRLETEGRRLRNDGSMFLANEVITPVRDPAGALRGFAKITRDITERVRAHEEKEALQNQLHQVQKLESVGQLAGGIAHDFNNLLSVVSGSAQFLLDRIEPGDASEEDLRQIKEAAKRGSALTRQLLIFSRRDLVSPEAIDLNNVVGQALNLLSRAIGEQVVIRTELEPGPAPVLADPGQIEQVLMNLAINARDAMTGGGTLTIRTAYIDLDEESSGQFVDLAPGAYVRLSVSDTGRGMTPAVAEKAFDPFFTTKPKGSGTGLGLAAVYGIVRGAGGHVSLATAEGFGSTFEIVLPRATTDTVAVLPETPRARGATGNGELILLVEDDDAVRAVTKRILVTHEYKVLESPGGKDAVMKFDANRDEIDLLLTDIVMPDMSGVELADRLRTISPSLKVVFMSGYSPGVFSGGEGDVDDPFLQKPFEREDLLNIMKAVLQRDSEPGATAP